MKDLVNLSLKAYQHWGWTAGIPVLTGSGIPMLWLLSSGLGRMLSRIQMTPESIFIYPEFLHQGQGSPTLD